MPTIQLCVPDTSTIGRKVHSRYSSTSIHIQYFLQQPQQFPSPHPIPSHPIPSHRLIPAAQALITPRENHNSPTHPSRKKKSSTRQNKNKKKVYPQPFTHPALPATQQHTRKNLTPLLPPSRTRDSDFGQIHPRNLLTPAITDEKNRRVTTALGQTFFFLMFGEYGTVVSSSSVAYRKKSDWS
ncbi:hypothetical protein L873DRAFT_1194428 [Choiromyces venosus 120613-1]|uniref:Uncharacterized protein n=1 Tax=Choiromyces venosus 120613-1 TaxID=1336337 RepID=A0A3N4JK30_9PEZI|nr:hypothetical protein L873DRAFT_1194428 [Choiromyces venosus 120613-1]